MKRSNYNYVIYKGNKSYWYNGVTHSCFILSENLGKKVEAAINMPDSLEHASKLLYDKLVDSGFIIEDNVDEIESIRKLNDAAIDDKSLRLTILPTLNCNFKCWYCIQDHIAGSKMSPEIIQRIKFFIEKKLNNDDIKFLNIEWFGGEPFIYFDVIEEISEFAQRYCREKKVEFASTATTNGYFLTEERVSFLKKYKFTRFQITLDGIRDSHNKVKFMKGCESAFDHVLANINRLMLNIPDLSILLRINYTRENLSSEIVRQICDYIPQEHRSRVQVMPKKVWQVATDKSYQVTTEDIWNQLKSKGFSILNSNIVSDFVPCYTCRSNFFAINYNGQVLKCTANDDLYATGSPRGLIDENGNLCLNEEYEKKFKTRSFENDKCLACKYLPLCMGVCPAHYDSSNLYCKLDSLDLSFEESIINQIESSIGK